MNQTFAITVVIPVLNREKFILRAVDSVLCQKGVTFEVIVVDNGSTDKTVSLLQKYIESESIKLIFCGQRGVAFARNAGIRAAVGDVIHILDSDNRMSSNYSLLELVDVFRCMDSGVKYVLTPNVDQHGMSISSYSISDTTLSVRQFLSLRGEFSITARSSYFKNNLHPEICGVTHEILFPNLLQAAVRGGVYLSERVIQVYSTEADNRLSSAELTPQQIINYQHYYLFSSLSLICVKQFWGAIGHAIKFLVYNRISDVKVDNYLQDWRVLRVLSWAMKLVPKKLIQNSVKKFRSVLC